MSQLINIRSNAVGVVLDEAAIEKVGELLSAEADGVFLRLGVRPGGCSGFNYEMYFDDEAQPEDVATEFTTRDGGQVKVVVDSASIQMVRGATIIYEDGLSGRGFRVENPNASHSCGCGNSFS